MVKKKKKEINRRITLESKHLSESFMEGGAGMKIRMDMADFRVMFSLLILAMYMIVLGFILV